MKQFISDLWFKLNVWSAIVFHFVVNLHPNKSRIVLTFFTFLSFCIIFNWQLSAILMVTLIIHEYGHIFALDLLNIPNLGFFPIPFIGGVTIFPREKVESFKNSFIIALLGPVIGAAFAGLTIIGYSMTHWNWLGGAAIVMIVINLFNLIPTSTLDGGVMYDAIVSGFSPRWKKASYSIMSAGVLALGLLSIKVSMILAVVLVAFATIQFFTRVRSVTTTNYEPITSPIQVTLCVIAYLTSVLLMLALLYPLAGVNLPSLIK